MFLPTFSDYFFFIVPLLLMYQSYSFFFKLNNNKVLVGSKQTTTVNNVGYGVSYTFISFFLFMLSYNFVYFYTVKSSNGVLWFNHITINNLFLFLLYFFTAVGFLFYFLLKQISKKKNLVKSLDFLVSVGSLIFLLPYLFCINTIFTFLFFLELLSTMLFYKLLSSKIWYKNNKNTTLGNTLPQNYINMVFFQYWVTFFSTIFIIYFYINVYYIFGTSDLLNIQYYYHHSDKKTTTFLGINTLLMLFVFSVIIKLGIAPLHLFKLEVYNGLPYVTIFFYTTFYFLVFFLFFLFFFSFFFGIFLKQVQPMFVLLFLLGSVYTIILLFDVSFIKTFFAYSTVINSLGFIAVFVSSL